MPSSRRSFLGASTAAVSALRALAAGRPNILWISIEDTSPQLGCYGDPLAHTPNLDRLAAEGVRFTNAYSTIGVCAPCRSSIITGVFPASIGTQHMRSSAAPPDHIRCFPEYLREAGYYCTNNSKTDYNFPVPKTAWDESSNKAHWKNRPAGKPFFSVFNLTITHESQILPRGEAHLKNTPRVKPNERCDPARVALPPYYIDKPEVRRDLANVYDIIAQMDYQAGDLLKEISDAGLANDTIVFFWSDHGVGLPRAKRWLYQSSTHVPLIVRTPERLRAPDQGKPGTVNDELVSLLDLGPTAINLAGAAVPGHMHGRAFLGANLKPRRKYVYGFRDRMDERYDMVRSVFDGRYRYIRNFDFHKPHYQYMNTAEQGPTMMELRKAHEAGQLSPQAERYFHPKPVEELYDVRADKHEMTNLAAQPGHAATLRKMRAECISWMREIKDTGLIPESELDALGKRYGTRYQILRQPENAGLLDKLLSAADASITRDSGTMVAMLSDAHGPVRQRAAIALGALPKLPSAAIPGLKGRLNDDSPGVRIAAAKALAQAGESVGECIGILNRELAGADDWIRLNAALALDELGAKARPAVEELTRHIDGDPNRYVGRVANHAVNQIMGTNRKVTGGFSVVRP